MRKHVALALLLTVLLALAAHVWHARYFLRFVPLPVTNVELVNGSSRWLPASEAYRPLGALFFPAGDLTTEEGLRRTLNEIQAASPTVPVASTSPAYPPTEFGAWASWVGRTPFYCTDATQMFLLAASEQGLAAREWQLLLPGWVLGQGHSLAEFYNPARQRWQVVDPQHAAILRDSAGEPASMAYVLARFAENRNGAISVDYGPFQEAMRKGARGPSVEYYLFDMGLLATAVLQLRQPTWFAEVRGPAHAVIGYPIIVSGWTHDHRVWTTKVAAVLAIGIVIVLAVLGWKRSRHPAAEPGA